MKPTGQTGRPRFAFFADILPVISSSLFLALFHYNLPSRIMFPPGFDQDAYLDGAKDFVAHFIFDQKCPLYTAWLGLFYVLCGYDLRLCFYVEKMAGMLLLSILVAYLGRRLFDLRTGLFLGIWILNCKYMVIEKNGSNVMAASLFVAGALCLTSLRGRVWRFPAAFLFLFLSTLMRPEMRMPFFLILAFVLLPPLFKIIRGKEKLQFARSRQTPYWAGAILVALLLTVAIRTHPSRLTWSTGNAFFLGYSVSYVKRHHLEAEFPEPMYQANEIVHLGMPKITGMTETQTASGIFDAIRLYPREVLTHVLFNVKVALHVLPAVFLGFDHRLVMALVFALYLGSYFFIEGSNRRRYKAIPAELWRVMALWGLAATLLIPISIAIIVYWRYFTPLLPVGMIATCYLIHRCLDLEPLRRWTAARSSTAV